MAIAKVIVTTPFPTAAETARRLGVSRTAAKKIKMLVDSVVPPTPIRKAKAKGETRRSAASAPR